MTPHEGSLTAHFAANVVASAAGFVEVADWAAVAVHAVGYASRVAVAPSLDAREPALREMLEASGASVLVAGGEDPATAMADVPVGIVAGVLGVAETGSVLVVEHDLGDRVTTMLCERLLLVVDRGAVRERLEAAAEWLSANTSGAGFAALLTGPSRTADIERSLTIGVQGAQEVDVVVLG
jgi:L-lactate dehydrogenase complex protein LldG